MSVEIQLLMGAAEVATVAWPALVAHTLRVDAETPLEQVQAVFQREPLDYLPVVTGKRYIGLVSRAQIGTVLGARFGFALFASHPVRRHLLPHPLSIVVDQPLLAVLQAALGRDAATFYDDVVLVDREQQLLGMIPVQTLVQLQSQLLAQKLAEVQQYAVRLEASNRELQDFAYIASHDLQEPLRKIQAFADRLAGKYGPQLDDAARDYLLRMQSAARRLQSLINDLLQISRIATRARPFEPVDLTTLAAEVVADLEVRLEQCGGRVEIGPLPVITGDPMQLRQLLQNLIGNALKFQRPGVAPVVRVSAHAGNGTVELIVADNGIGFEPQHHDKIFAMFQRLHGREQYEGNGVGLAICRKITDRHGGSITAEGVPNVGATFRVRLPLAVQPGDVA
jgi:signal transduction histidine kinase